MKKIVDDERLIYKVCCLYYQDDMNQKEVGDYLGISRSSVLRILRKGKELGIVTIELHNPRFYDYGDMEKKLDEVYITVNKNKIPFDPESPFVTSGIRIGTPAVTSRGFKEEDCRELADIIADCIFDYEGKKEESIKRVKALTDKYPVYPDIV